ncbi:HpcH/HpaI aldolase/citrate lyase family protein [Cellulomonas endophytica]|uniref:HpcH/HpaI aldolase/citrate lyase family protein n=1 Tax=Cellulomonas endophytica TaxID=2494735 RepID=UPI001012F9BE|nr:aldolase/citrate lyase family protein [Cellulomonas endophytica]
MSRPVLTLLYAPADRPDRAAKALAGDADVVVLDLEDAVAPVAKSAARAGLAALVAAHPGRPVQVRLNAAGTSWADADRAAVAALPLHVEVRVPKVERVEEVAALVGALPGRRLHLLLESALGVERAFDLASADPAVASVGLGEADLRSALGIREEAGLTWARGRLVVAARAAGLPAPVMSVHPHVRDEAGLRASCRAGRALGLRGRAAIHPAQLAPIREEFLPAPDEVARAREVLRRVGDAREAGAGVLVLEDGTFLDVAMVAGARDVLALVGDPGAEGPVDPA